MMAFGQTHMEVVKGSLVEAVQRNWITKWSSRYIKRVGLDDPMHFNSLFSYFRP